MTAQTHLERALAITELVAQRNVVKFKDPKSKAQIIVHSADSETMSMYVVNDNGIASSEISVEYKVGQKKTRWALHELFSAIIEDEGDSEPIKLHSDNKRLNPLVESRLPVTR